MDCMTPNEQAPPSDATQSFLSEVQHGDQPCPVKGSVALSLRPCAQWLSRAHLLAGLQANCVHTLEPGCACTQRLTSTTNSTQLLRLITCRWSSRGPSAWANLKELHLDANLLRGILPSTWGSGGSFPAIVDITLDGNRLTGTVPASWGAGPNGSTAFKTLPSVTLRPGAGHPSSLTTCEQGNVHGE